MGCKVIYEFRVKFYAIVRGHCSRRWGATRIFGPSVCRCWRRVHLRRGSLWRRHRRTRNTCHTAICRGRGRLFAGTRTGLKWQWIITCWFDDHDESEFVFKHTYWQPAWWRRQSGKGQLCTSWWSSKWEQSLDCFYMEQPKNIETSSRNLNFQAAQVFRARFTECLKLRGESFTLNWQVIASCFIWNLLVTKL